MVVTRVIFARKASTCMSNMSLKCSSKDSGTPVGESGSVTSVRACCSAFWMRRSISRISSKYSVRRVRSEGGSFFHYRIEQTAAQLFSGLAVGIIAAVPKELFENHLRVVFHGKRRGGR